MVWLDIQTQEDRMSQPTVPTLQPHHGYKSWTSYWRDANQRPRSKRFGKSTEVSKRAAMALYQHWINNEFPALAKRQNVRYGVDALCNDYFGEIQREYVGDDGKYTGTVHRHKAALESFGTMYQGTEADGMTAAKVAEWMRSYLKERRMNGRALAGQQVKVAETVNTALGYLKRMYRWGAETERVSEGAAGAVRIVRNLKRTNVEARQKDEILPVEREAVEAAQKKCGAVLRDMLEVQWHTGMRPAEVCQIRRCDLDMTGDVWVYSPVKHKTRWRGRVRKVAIGPQAQAVIGRYLTPSLSAPLFTRNGKPYTAAMYRIDLRKAAELAGLDPFNPNQLRHSYATRVEREFGAEAVRDILGHASLKEQDVYVRRGLERAIEVARKVG